MNFAHESTLIELQNFMKEKFKNINLNESCKLVSDNWNREKPTNDKEYNIFYEKDTDYIFEISNFSNSVRRKKIFIKLKKVLNENNIKNIIDFGAGVGSDTIELHKNNFNVKYLEINEIMKKFFEYRCKIRNITIPTIEKIEKTECIMFVDVIEHFKNPFDYLKKFCDNSKYLLFTQSFGEHDENRGGMPYHTDYKMHDIIKYLIDNGFEKIKIKQAFPPYLFKKNGDNI